jgi:hypothetical protein
MCILSSFLVVKDVRLEAISVDVDIPRATTSGGVYHGRTRTTGARTRPGDVPSTTTTRGMLFRMELGVRP